MNEFSPVINDLLGCLEERNLLPASWQLTDETANQIRALSTLIISVVTLPSEHWPACSICANKEILIDQGFLNDLAYEREEIFATILHELGHLIESNTPKANMVSYVDGLRRISNGLEDEFKSDAFVVKVGHAKDLICCLKKLQVDKRFCLLKDQIEKRIKKVEDPDCE